MKLLKSVIFIFLLSFTTHAFAKSNEYYKATLVHLLTECDSDCQKLVFKEEIDLAFFELMNAILNQVRWELTMKQKESYD
jgi:hypothetical protein